MNEDDRAKENYVLEATETRQTKKNKRDDPYRAGQDQVLNAFRILLGVRDTQVAT